MTTSTFTAIPPEIRAIVYAHVFDHVQITTGADELLDVTLFPYQLTAVSRLIRTEALPHLHKNITLACQSGYFPDQTRRRFPDRVLRNITKIVILDDIMVDEIKPTRRLFPRLKIFEINVVCYQGFRRYGLIKPRSKVDPLQLFRECMLCILVDLHMEMVMPREGLERDYLPEDTLWEIMKLDSKRRGFDIIARRRAWNDGDDSRRACDAIVTEIFLA